jgi:hypothetical protein
MPTNKQVNAPPPIESILADVKHFTDTGYLLKVHLNGLHGAWHRLWGLLVLNTDLGGMDEGIVLVTKQIQEIIGRPITTAEITKLRDHAETHMLNVRKQRSNGKS